MPRSTHNPWLAKFAVFTAFATLCLIGIGGVVTSKGVGMAVPDWPTTYGYNMFLFPISKWVGGIRDEHTHRLFASWVGMLTTILAFWVWLREERPWLRKLTIIAFFAVVAQGVLGGLRVVKMKDEIGIFHAVLAQSFLCLMLAIAVFLSRWWQRLSAENQPTVQFAIRLKPLFILTTALIFAQLTLGATMRHQHAGLAVPDFPLAYGSVWPATDPASIERYNQLRTDDHQFNAITAPQIHLHMTHRLMALVILAMVAICWFKMRAIAWEGERPREPFNPTRNLPESSRGRSPSQLFAFGSMRRLTNAWLGIILLQAVLGVVTVLKNKPADIATAHVVVGAASLALGTLISMMLVRLTDGRALQAAPAMKTELAGSRG